MDTKPNGNGEGQVQVQVFEIAIRWLPQTAQLQVIGPQVDDVVKLGMLEAAKMVLMEQRAQANAGKGPALIVPGRFAH